LLNLFSLIVEALPSALGANRFFVAHGLMACLVILAAVLANIVTRKYLLTTVGMIVRKSQTNWDDSLLEHRVFHRLSHLAPAIVLYMAAGLYPNTPDFTFLMTGLQRLALLYMTVFSIGVVFAFFDAIQAIYGQYDISRSRPIKGYLQAIKVLLACFTLVLIISQLTERSPLYLLSGLGALTAVLLLVFKDPILGFVAGIQLASNNMVRTGDWIAVPNHSADGDVVDVSLTTVKVQNWDKSITSIPIYALVSDSFTNWRGMLESGGRRIKRSFTLDMRSIGFAEDTLLEQLLTLDLIGPEIIISQAALAAYKAEHVGKTPNPANEPRPTNVRLFREYTTAYLRAHHEISDEMTFLVRLLQPDRNGLPMEIYVFCNDQNWVAFEKVQSEIMEHMLAVLPQFDLRIFQIPSGHDMEHFNPQAPSG